jgi:acyl-coenzyme A thioesterase PaaI-like protein
MNPATHLGVTPHLVGAPGELAVGRARCTLDTTREMTVDSHGLVHGGFVFGLADYAAMLAVNDPNVVLGAAAVRFTAPVAHPARMAATAQITGETGRKRIVTVEVTAGDQPVLAGELTCFVLDNHVLEGEESR